MVALMVIGAGRPILVTVDDLPIASGRWHRTAEDRAAVTRGLLEALAKHRIKAVAFVTGRNVQGPKDVELLRQWIAAGHELGNHSESHLSYTQTSSAAYIEDVEIGRARVAEVAGRVRFFRFPFLREGDTREKLDAMRAYLASSAQANLPVTIDDQDWSFEDAWVKADAAGKKRVADEYHAAMRLAVRHHEERGDELFGRAVPQVLLLHATGISAAEWPALFDWLVATGHTFATADEVLRDPAFAVEHHVVAPFGFGLWDRLWREKKEAKARAEVERTLAKQVAAWNEGDIAGFCSVYAEDALFISPSGQTRGRAAVEARYRAKYPGKAAMGTLALEPVEVRVLDGVEFTPAGDAAPSRVHGVTIAARWSLTYPGKPAASGLTLLVMRPRHSGWEIVQDASM